MSEFYVSLDNLSIANQIADMVNKYNKWSCKFSGQSILLSNGTRYFVEIEGSRIVGCAGYVQDYERATKIQHICVLPTHRGHGIAKKLTGLTIKHATTEYVYMTIREDNLPSIKMAISLGFEFSSKRWFRDHWTLTFVRRV